MRFSNAVLKTRLVSPVKCPECGRDVDVVTMTFTAAGSVTARLECCEACRANHTLTLKRTTAVSIARLPALMERITDQIIGRDVFGD